MNLIRHLLEAKIGLVGVGAAIAALGIAVHFSLMTEVRLAENRIDEVTQIEAELNREIGYGGLIHNFKNFVLRGSQNYRTAALRNHARASELLDALHALESNNAFQDYQLIRSTLDAYRDNIEVAADAKRRHLSIEEIDQMVNIDDSGALHQISTHMEDTRATLRRQRDSLIESQTQIFIALCVFLGAFVLITTALATGIAKRIQQLQNRCQTCPGLQVRAANQPTKARSMT